MKARVLAALALTVSAFVVFFSSVALAQSAPVVVSIESVECRATVEAVRTEPYSDGGPWASIPSNCGRQAQEGPRAQFRIRAWKEADSTRVVLYAVEREAALPDKEREIQIGTYLMQRGQTIRPTETTAYTSNSIVLSAQ
jgi:hypothetical protein